MFARTRRVKKFVSDHRVLIAVAATATVCVYGHIKVVNGWNEFLTEHDLYDTFYFVED